MLIITSKCFPLYHLQKNTKKTLKVEKAGRGKTVDSIFHWLKVEPAITWNKSKSIKILK